MNPEHPIKGTNYCAMPSKRQRPAAANCMTQHQSTSFFLLVSTAPRSRRPPNEYSGRRADRLGGVGEPSSRACTRFSSRVCGRLGVGCLCSPPSPHQRRPQLLPAGTTPWLAPRPRAPVKTTPILSLAIDVVWAACLVAPALVLAPVAAAGSESEGHMRCL